MTDALSIDVLINEKESSLTLSIDAINELAPALQTVTVTLDGTEETFSWQGLTDFVYTRNVSTGRHHLTLHFNGLLPAGVLKLPPTTTAITSVLPPLVDPVTAQRVSLARLWPKGFEPKALEILYASLFVHNTQLTSLRETFAHLPNLKTLPVGLLFPLIYAKDFTGTFKDSGLSALSEDLFNSATEASNFTETFMGCKTLLSIPEKLFAMNDKANTFVRTFADSNLETIPATLFQSACLHSNYEQTFARTQIAEVPEGLLTGKYPSNVDGMFEPRNRLTDDPMNIKASPRLYSAFLKDTLHAYGVPSKAFCSDN